MKPTNKEGLTLLELIITFTIASVLLLIGFTSFNNEIKAQNTQSSVKQAGYAIKKARSYSKINGAKTKITFLVGSNTYEVTADGKVLTNKDLADSFSGVLPVSTKILSNTCSDIYFYADGTPINSSGTPISSNCTISFGYDNQFKKSITLVAISGNIIYE